MSRHQLLTALRNERIIKQRVFHEKGIFPGPEPMIKLPIDKVLVDKEKKRFLIGMDDLIKVIEEAIPE